MIKKEFVREDNCNFLRLTCDDGLLGYDKEMKMVMKNNLPYILKVNSFTINNNISYYYEILYYKPLSVFCQNKPLSIEDITNIVISLKGAINSIDIYLLNSEGIMLEPDCIFVEPSTSKAHFVYAPFENREFNLGVRRLFEFFMEHMNHSDKIKTIRFYDMYQEIAKGNVDLENVVNELMQEPYNDNDNAKEEVYEIPSVAPEVVESEKEIVCTPCEKYIFYGKAIIIFLGIVLLCSQALSSTFPVKIPLMYAAAGTIALVIAYLVLSTLERMPFMYRTKLVSVKHKIPYQITSSDIEKNMEDTNKELVHKVIENRKLEGKESAYEEQAEHTTLLSDYIVHNNGIVLEYVGCEKIEQKRVGISEFPCVIGSGNDADVIILLPFVSRKHLTIEKCDEEYFVTDLFSTNGTSINDVVLSPGAKIRLNDGDIISIASYEYRVIT